jgi:hypothetical protein
MVFGSVAFLLVALLTNLTIAIEQVINKAGGLVYQRSLSQGLAHLTSNEYLVLAGTLHGIHAITSRLSPAGASSGAQVIEGESVKITILLTSTGLSRSALTPHPTYVLPLNHRDEIRTIDFTSRDIRRGNIAEGLRGLCRRCHEKPISYARDADS